MEKDKSEGYENPYARPFASAWSQIEAALQEGTYWVTKEDRPGDIKDFLKHTNDEIGRILKDHNPPKDEGHRARRSDILDELKETFEGLQLGRVLHALEVALRGQFIKVYEESFKEDRSKGVKAGKERYEREWKRPPEPWQQTHKPKEVDWESPPPKQELPDHKGYYFLVRDETGALVPKVPGERVKGKEPQSRPQDWLKEELVRQFESVGKERMDAYTFTQQILREFFKTRLADGGIDAARRPSRRKKVN